MLTEFTQVKNTGQLTTFLYAILFGIALCLVYDFYRSFLAVITPIKLVEDFADILYFFFISIGTFCFLLVECNGEIRFFAIVGFLMGFFGFRKFLSRYIRHLFTLTFSITVKTTNFILFPFFSILKQCYNLFSKFCHNTVKTMKFFSKNKEKPLANDMDIDV